MYEEAVQNHFNRLDAGRKAEDEEKKLEVSQENGGPEETGEVPGAYFDGAREDRKEAEEGGYALVEGETEPAAVKRTKEFRVDRRWSEDEVSVGSTEKEAVEEVEIVEERKNEVEEEEEDYVVIKSEDFKANQ